MNNLDIGILIVLGASTLLGLFWGLIRQVLAVAGVILGLIVAGRYGDAVASALSSFVGDAAVGSALGFIVAFIAVSALVSLLASLLRFFVGLLFLGWLDHLLGAVLGLVQGLIACIALLLAAQIFRVPAWQPSIEGSQIAQVLLALSAPLQLLLPDGLRLLLT